MTGPSIASKVAGGPRSWFELGVLVALRASERLLVVIAALTAARDHLLHALALAGLLASIFGARGVVSAALTRRVRSGLVRVTASSVLEGDVLEVERHTGDGALLRIFEGVYASEKLLTEHAPALVAEALASVVLACLVVEASSPRLVIVGAVAVLLAAALVAIARSFTARLSATAHDAHGAVIERLAAMVNGRVDLVASGRGRAFASELDERAQLWSTTAMRAERFAAAAGRAPMLAAVLAVGAAVLFDHASRDTGIAAALEDAALFGGAVPAFAGLSRALVETGRAMTKLAPFAALLDVPPASRGAGAALPSLPARIEWSDLSFAYPRETGEPSLALHRANAIWEPGTLLVVTGPNGAGKSTLFRLLLGMLRPASGEIRIGGADLLDHDLDAWRRSIAYLPQRPFFPERANVREAIALLARDADAPRMEAALSEVELLPTLLQKSPDSPLTVAVSALSVGERQRLALARALAQDTSILLLDEPDANLDHRGIDLVVEIVTRRKAGHMIAVAAHTAELARVADVVVSFSGVSSKKTAGYVD